MIKELEHIERLIQYNRQTITNITKDQECEEYLGYNFRVGRLNIKFRKAKITPKKTGQFVTLWKRNIEKQTVPFDVNDNFDFYIIATAQDDRFGIYLFPKTVLGEKQILTKEQKEGKRGFRIYPDWAKTTSVQAEKAKSWQTKYFLDLTNEEEQNISKFNRLFFTTEKK